MTRRRRFLSPLATILLLIGLKLPESGFAAGLRYLAFGYMAVALVLHVGGGYLRRRPHWTADSWRRYLKAAAVPVGALAIAALMMAAFEWRLPMVGAARSTLRGVWAGGTLFFGVIGAVGLGTALDWLHEGDPSRQFVLPGWLTFGRRRAA